MRINNYFHMFLIKGIISLCKLWENYNKHIKANGIGIYLALIELLALDQLSENNWIKNWMNTKDICFRAAKTCQVRQNFVGRHGREGNLWKVSHYSELSLSSLCWSLELGKRTTTKEVRKQQRF